MENEIRCEYAEGPHYAAESGPRYYTCKEGFGLGKKCLKGYDHAGTIRIKEDEVLDVNLCPVNGFIPSKEVRII